MTTDTHQRTTHTTHTTLQNAFEEAFGGLDFDYFTTQTASTSSSMMMQRHLQEICERFEENRAISSSSSGASAAGYQARGSSCGSSYVSSYGSCDDRSRQCSKPDWKPNWKPGRHSFVVQRQGVLYSC